MARRTETIALGGEAYELTQLPAKEGLAVYSKLLRVLGPMIREVLNEGSAIDEIKAARKLPKPGDQPVDEGAPPSAEGLDVSDKLGMKIASIVIRGIETLETSLLEELADKFARCSKCQLDKNGPMVEMHAGDIFDNHFAGRYMQLTQWLLAHLRLNFADFLGASRRSGSPSPAR
jgi:hypothetical protein